MSKKAFGAGTQLCLPILADVAYDFEKFHRGGAIDLNQGCATINDRARRHSEEVGEFFVALDPPKSRKFHLTQDIVLDEHATEWNALAFNLRPDLRGDHGEVQPNEAKLHNGAIGRST